MFKKYIMIPFLDGGRDFEGVDCWGLVYLIMKTEYGIEIPDYKISCTDFFKINLQISIEKTVTCRWKKIDKLEDPSLILFSLHKNPKIINHIGLYIGGSKFIHIIKEHRSTITRLPHPFYDSKMRGFYSYAG